MKVKVKRVPSEGLYIEDDKYKMLSPFTAEVMGEPHSEGGTDIAYYGKLVEAEKGEPISINNAGDATIFGAMNIPGSKKTFKSAAKDIAKQEKKNFSMQDKATILIQENSPYNTNQAFAFSSGMALQDAAVQRERATNEKKELLGNIQEMMLLKADEMGVTPKKFSTMMKKNGGKIPMYKEGGKVNKEGLTPEYRGLIDLFDEENIPYRLTSTTGGKHIQGSHHYSGNAFDIVPADGNFDSLNKSIFENPRIAEYIANNNIGFINEDLNTGGIKTPKSTGSHFHFGADSRATRLPKPYIGRNGRPFSPIQGASIPQETPVDTSTQDIWTGEYMSPIPQSIEPTPIQERGYEPIPIDNPQSGKRSKLGSLADINKLGIGDFLSEIPAILDRPDFVPQQQYQPQLMTPYQVSFQDQLNQNASTFRGVSQSLVNNPEALSVLAGQKYGADQSVLANQFRTNQGIQNQIYNQNVATQNDAQLRNLQLADQQFVRQSQAQSNTESRRQQALASISNKKALNQRDNMDIRLRETMFDYRYNPQTGEMEYIGEPAAFGFTPPDVNKVVTRRDANGNIISVSETDLPYYQEQLQQQKTQDARRRAANLSTRKWGGFMKKMKSKQ